MGSYLSQDDLEELSEGLSKEYFPLVFKVLCSIFTISSVTYFIFTM